MERPALNLYTSSRVEVLAEDWLRLMTAPAGGPMEPEWLVVQNAGMGRWLQLMLAERQGVTMNLRVCFPRNFVLEMAARLQPQAPVQVGLDPSEQVWAVYRALEELRREERFPELRAYLGENDPLKHYQLARRAAQCLDNYALYRPQWLDRWEAGEAAEDWQAQLWRRLCTGREVLLAAVIALAMKVIGILLITALLIIPAAAARRFAARPWRDAGSDDGAQAACGSGCGHHHHAPPPPDAAPSAMSAGFVSSVR